jgi:hypothetical protein
MLFVNWLSQPERTVHDIGGRKKVKKQERKEGDYNKYRRW